MKPFDEEAVSILFVAVFKQMLVLNLMCVEIECPSELYQPLKGKKGRESKIQILKINAVYKVFCVG